jgi:hypothetical protein
VWDLPQQQTVANGEKNNNSSEVRSVKVEVNICCCATAWRHYDVWPEINIYAVTVLENNIGPGEGEAVISRTDRFTRDEAHLTAG